MPTLAHAMLRPLVFTAAVLIPAGASAAPPHRKSGATARVHKVESKGNDLGPRVGVAEKESSRGGSAAHPKANGPSRGCFSQPVEVVAGSESATFSLTKCDGSTTPLAVDQLSILARSSTASKPKQPLEILAKATGPDLAPGVRRFDARVVERLAKVVEHFHVTGETSQVALVSGYRPRGAGSYHSAGRAVDFRLAGVANEALVAFCKTLQDTGCGYYPNSGFVHIDVRDPGAGHVAWIDVSRPGQTPRYVTQWPTVASSETAKLPALPAPDAPVSASSPGERGNASPHSI